MGHESFLLCKREVSEHLSFKRQVETTVEEMGNKIKDITYCIMNSHVVVKTFQVSSKNMETLVKKN